MAIVRAKRPVNHFTIISNEVLRDSRLSFKARGLLACILSRPDNWRTTADSLAKESKEGRTAILSGLQELKDIGYMIQTKHRDEKGKWAWESTVYDKPIILEPEIGSPLSGFPTTDAGFTDNLTILEDYIKKSEEEKLLLPAVVVTTQPTVGGANKIVAEYFDSWRELHGEEPLKNQVGQLARLAKSLLAEGADYETLIRSARKCAETGHARLDSSYAWIKANKTRGAVDSKRVTGINESLELIRSLEAQEDESENEIIWELTSEEE